MNAPIKRTLASLSVGVVLGLGGIQLVFLMSSVAHAATWSDNHCNGDAYDIPGWKRSQAQNYVQDADHEGYEWGGGCYKLDNQDNTPNQPDSGGEGADCSGLVFKTWAMNRGYGDGGFHFWQHEKEVHGPYNTGDFYSPPNGVPFDTENKSYFSTDKLDAFVYHSSGAGHIGMIYKEGDGGFDYIAEAKSDAIGTRIAYLDYRQQSAYRAVFRKNWTPECYPRCR